MNPYEKQQVLKGILKNKSSANSAGGSSSSNNDNFIPNTQQQPPQVYDYYRPENQNIIPNPRSDNSWQSGGGPGDNSHMRYNNNGNNVPYEDSGPYNRIAPPLHHNHPPPHHQHLHHHQPPPRHYEEDVNTIPLATLSHPQVHQPSMRRNVITQKLQTLLNNKGTTIFSPLGDDEKPSNEIERTPGKNKDHYAVVPAFDFFLRLSSFEKRMQFFKDIQVGELVVAVVVGKTVSGLLLHILNMDGGKRSYVEDLDIRGLCSNENLIPFDPENPNKDFVTKDLVRCEILQVIREKEQLMLGMKGITQTIEMQHAYKLGAISEHELPKEFIVSREETRRRVPRDFEDILESSIGFNNQNNVAYLASSLGIYNHKCTLTTGLRRPFPVKDTASGLRRAQNGQWARGNVAAGIQYFKEGNKTEAFQSLNQALTIDPENVEGLVARGALYSHCNSLDKAVEEFEAALKINPNHNNARRYLVESLIALGKREQETSNYEGAFNYLAKSLAVWPENKSGTEAAVALFEQLEKLDKSRIASAPLAKIMEVKGNLKALLIQNIGMGQKDVKGSKNSSSGRRSSGGGGGGRDSSYSSWSDSDSESSSSREGKVKKRRKKSKRKSSKKAKRTRKDSGELSPFSRRITPGQPTFNDSSTVVSGAYPPSSSWKTASQIDAAASAGRGDSDDSKKSSRKGKDKKRSKKSKRKKSKRSSSDSDDRKSRERSFVEKNEAYSSVAGVIQNLGLGDLDAQLAEDFSKIQKVLVNPPVKPTPTVQVVTRTIDPHPNEYYDRRSRNYPSEYSKQELDRSSIFKPEDVIPSSKVKLQVDESGNFVKTLPENIIRTVQNDAALIAQPTASDPNKFAMRFNVKGPQPLQGSALDAPGLDLNSAEASSLSQFNNSKWRTVGAPETNPADLRATLSRKDVPPIVIQNTGADTTQQSNFYYGDASTTKPGGNVITEVPGAQVPVKPVFKKSLRQTTNTLSRSRSKSRSRSRSNSSHRKKRRSYSRSRSRSSSPRRRRRSVSRSRSRSHSPYDRRRVDRPPRFRRRSRSISRSRSPRVQRVRRSTFETVASRGRGLGRAPRGRNRFSRSRSRSYRSSRSRSGSPRRRKRDLNTNFVSPNYLGRNPHVRGGRIPFAGRGRGRIIRGSGRRRYSRSHSRSRSRSKDRSPRNNEKARKKSPVAEKEVPKDKGSKKQDDGPKKTSDSKPEKAAGGDPQVAT